MLSANSYMFRHQDAILKEFNNNKGSQVQRVLQVLIALSSLELKMKYLKMLKFHTT